ncbi:GerAB/ArcD/ProY family transporter [Syntrophaceticus schinkii]|jgi:spore germination protein KB|uniref:Spore germination protein n=1 Tax=Syntrophaceticus schinkii TaxID=499207 RepID=A0A0B7MQ24_9FIRM|nr:endospore germination permease [Syntrophaceticus schinkii]MDD2359575.1 endospore germination permease [Syntrophaceticus schinkii]MDD4260761.1 endospore germination permease [Syntrophaceticus schinkii]MDD4674877.1 endospore germination permease [Syntrophaceticus schinkii]CEO89772.1 Spore germination protein [Syntrophaceticus schinkii]
MLDKGRISSVQLLLLLIIADAATAFLYGPAASIQLAGRDSWLSVSALASVSGLAVALVSIGLARRFPQQVFTEYLPQILGGIPGKILAGIYAAVFIHYTAVIVNEGSTFIHVAFLRETPVMAIEIIGILAAIYAVCLGIEVIARQNELSWPVWALSLLLILLLVAKEINPENFKPFLENGIMPVIKGSFVVSPFRGEVFLLLMLFPYLNQKQEALKTAGYYVLAQAVLPGIITAVIIGVFGDIVPTYMVFPTYNLARYISVAQFLERIQILIVVMWMAGLIVKMAVFYHSAAIAAATTLGLKNYRITLLPIAIATVVISRVFYGTQLHLTNFLFKTWPYYGGAVQLLIPAIMLLIAIIRKKGGENAS